MPTLKSLQSLSILGALSLFGLAPTGCGGDQAAADDERADEEVVPEGKQDDFYSTSAKEYWASATSTVTIEAALADKPEAERKKRAQELVQLKDIAISWFLNQYLIDKEDHDGNSGYGGFNALTRFASEENGTIEAVDKTTFRFTFKVQIAGARTLISKLPGTSAAGGKRVPLKIGKVANEDLARLEFNHEWYRDSPWTDFDPSKLTAEQLETLDLLVAPQPATKDAYLAYDRLFADGELTIAAHFGWDYHNRYDIIGSRNLYNWAVRNGFASPVASYDKLLRTSAPLTRTVTSNGKDVVVKLWIFHPGDASKSIPGPDPDTDAGGKVLENDMRESFAKREVVIFEGHSGPLYGFALANWKKTEEGDLDDSKIPGMEMLRGHQIVLANGCDTYALGQAFWENPAKADKKDLNIITSTSFSNAGTEASAERLIVALTNQTRGKVVPVKVSELTAGFDDDQGYGFHTMYGVHGVDANPKRDPMADVSKLGAACTSDAACGADGNRCTRVSTTRRICTYACIDDTGCTGGARCRSIAQAGRITTKQCVPPAR